MTALEDSENKIKSAFRRGLEATCVIAKELHKIYASEAYTLISETWADYIKIRLNMDIRSYRRIIGVSQTIAQLQDAGLALPANQNQAEELSRLDPQLRAKIWNHLVVQAERDDRTLTAEDIKRAVDEAVEVAGKAQVNAKAPPAGIEIDMDDKDNGASPPAKKPKPEVQEGQLILTEKGEAALNRIRKICGEEIADAIQSGAKAMTEREIRNWAEYDEAMVRTLTYYVIDKNWPLSKAVAFEQREIQESTDVSELIMIASARGGSARVNFNKAKITIELA